MLSGALLLLSVLAISIWGLRLGLDFKGGTLLEVRFSKNSAPDARQVQSSLEPLGLQSLSVQGTEGNGSIIRYLNSDETTNNRVMEELEKADAGLTLLRTDFIGASVSEQMKSSAFWGILFSILGIAGYIALAFRKVSQPISSWDYGWGAVIALAHDIVITIGAFAVFGHFLDIEVGIPFVAALLTILGYSVNDSIVVYDRIRENLLRSRAKADFETLVNRSVNETMSRSINTSMTVMIVLAAIAIFGGESIRWFAIALLIGVGFGTYSSVFVASALLVTRYAMKHKK